MPKLEAKYGRNLWMRAQLENMRKRATSTSASQDKLWKSILKIIHESGEMGAQ
jgi:hypothetical protein